MLARQSDMEGATSFTSLRLTFQEWRRMELIEYPVTYGIIGINVIVFILLNIKVLSIQSVGSSYINTLQERQYYRIISSAFSQKDFLHLVCNMYSLYNIGQALEYALKSGLYAICYFLIMILGGTVSARIHKKNSPFTFSIGASGVICGLLGIYMVIVVSMRGIASLKAMIPTIVLLVIMTTSKKIDSIGHFSGLITGLIAGLVIVNIYRFG